MNRNSKMTNISHTYLTKIYCHSLSPFQPSNSSLGSLGDRSSVFSVGTPDRVSSPFKSYCLSILLHLLLSVNYFFLFLQTDFYQTKNPTDSFCSVGFSKSFYTVYFTYDPTERRWVDNYVAIRMPTWLYQALLL